MRGGQRPHERKGRAALPWNEPPMADILARLAERDEREAMDDRTAAERWLGDPPLWRSAAPTLSCSAVAVAAAEWGGRRGA